MKKAAPRTYVMPTNDYPAKVEAFTADGRVIWTAIVEPNTRLYVPPLAKMHKCPIGIRITLPNGEIMQTDPPNW